MKERKIKKWAVIGTICCILGISSGIYTVSAAIKEKIPLQKNISYKTVSKETTEDGRKNFQADYEGITELKVYGYDATVLVREGDKFSVTAANIEEDYEITNENGILSLGDKDTFWERQNRTNNWYEFWKTYYNKNASITIEIPKGLKLEDVVLFNDKGKFTVENLNTKKLYIDTGSGIFKINKTTAEETGIDGGSGLIEGNKNIFGETVIDTGSGYSSFTDCQVKNLYLNTGSGDTMISGNVTGNSTVDTGSGDVILNLSGKKEEYSYDIDSGSGIIKIGGEIYKDGYHGGNLSNSFYINSGSGDITINFESEVLTTDDRVEQVIREIENADSNSVQPGVQITEKELKTEEAELSEINKIYFELGNTSVYFYVTDESKIKIIQKANKLTTTQENIEKELKDYVIEPQEIFTTTKIGDSLRIKTENRKPQENNNYSKNNRNLGTTLYVYIPKTYLKNIETSTELGDVIFYDSIKYEQININTELGDIIAEKNLEVQNIKLQSNLGDICLSGLVKADRLEIIDNLGDLNIYGKLDLDTLEVSMSLGDIELLNDVKCKTLKINSSLGDCTINKPINCDVIDIHIQMGDLQNNGLTASQKKITIN